MLWGESASLSVQLGVKALELQFNAVKLEGLEEM